LEAIDNLKTHSVASHELRNRAIAEYHDLLAEDPALSATLFEKLRSGMRANRLVYGERPLGVALRPHVLDTIQFRTLARTAELVASALEKVTRSLIASPHLLPQFGLTDTEIKLALIDPGLPIAGITTRLDSFVHGTEIKFVEYNAENPSSLSDQEGLNRILFELPAMARFAERYRLQQFSPAQALLESLLETYHEWGGSGAPNVAILDWENLPTSNEFVLLRNHFAGHGVRTIICSPEQLDYDGTKLRCGDFRIDLVYKRVIIHEFLERYDETHPLIRAYTKRHVCMVNPFRCKIMHKKAIFESLTDQTSHQWLSSDEIEAIDRSVPWTRRVSDRRTTLNENEIQLLEFIRRNRAGLVLKPNDDYGGHGVFLGSQLDDRGWDDAISKALKGDYVVQEAIELRTEHFPIFGEGEWQLQPMFVDTNPFLFRGKVCGAMVRLSSSPVVNVTSGGGETGFFVLEHEA
jgi:hypothetical protein